MVSVVESKEEIKKYLENVGMVNQLPHYPDEDLYLRVQFFGIPFLFERGHDTFYYNNYETASKREYWYISKSDIEEPPLYIEQGFKTLEGALQVAMKKYRKELDAKYTAFEFLEKEIKNKKFKNTVKDLKLER